MSNKRHSKRIWIIIASLLIASACLIVAGVAISSFLNLGASPPPPPQTTPLPTFAPPQATATPSPTPEAAANETAGAPSPTPTPPLANTAAQLPDPGGYRWALVAEGFSRPVDLAHASDGSGRLFVVEQPGVIRVLLAGVVLPTPFLDIRDRVGDEGSEQGLLGLAFPPDYPQTGYFYLNYTDQRGDTVIARYRVSAEPNIADPGTETRLLQVRQPYANHNGGGLAFGPDGYLYIGLGDGGSAG